MGQEAYGSSLSSVWDTYLALRVLCKGGSTAFEVGLDPSKNSRVQACLAWRPEGPGDFKEQQGRTRELLKLLAIRGFAAIPTRGDELAMFGTDRGLWCYIPI
jgi:hypothetical protein